MTRILADIGHSHAVVMGACYSRPKKEAIIEMSSGTPLGDVGRAQDATLPQLFEHGEYAIEWGTVATAHRTVLLEGRRQATEMAIAMLKPHLNGPLVCRRPGEALALDAEPPRTLILEDIATLNADEQKALRCWLSDISRPAQVVSTASHPLFPLVERGMFDENLYYRLNVMLLRLEEA